MIKTSRWLGATLTFGCSLTFCSWSVADASLAEVWPSRVAARLSTPALEARIDQLLRRMSLEEKIGQMIQADIASIEPDDLRRYPLGSILAGGNAAPGGNLRSPPAAWRDLTQALHEAALASQAGGHVPIPLIFGIDAVHGNAKIRGATIFPHNVGLGATHDPALITRIGQTTALEVAALGIDWTFAPTVAVARDGRWGRAYESYSDDPLLVARYAPAMLTGLQGTLGSPEFLDARHTLGSVKHFLGDGGTRAGRDQGETQLDEEQLARVHGAGYLAALQAGAPIVMASYNSFNGVKMHVDYHLLTEVLKQRLGFEGFIVGDWNGHEQIPGCTKTRCPQAYLAGIDMLMAPDSWKALFETTLAEARDGELPEARIDDAVRRILRVKLVAGLFDRPPRGLDSQSPSIAELGSAEHRALARQAVRESLVLLKNGGRLLPLAPDSHVLLAGRGADDIAMQCGGWTIDWQGNHNTPADFPGAQSIADGLRAALAHGSLTVSPDGRYASKPDVAIVVFGEGPYAEFQGDRETLNALPESEKELKLLRELKHAGIPTVAILLSGRPLWVNPFLNAADAFVAAWLPGSEGGGVADLLVRGSDGSRPYPFTGRLSFAWPDTPMPVTYAAHGPSKGVLFPSGYGIDESNAEPLRPLPEVAKVSAAFAAPAGSLFHAGHPTAPWSLFVADDEAEVHVTTEVQQSPHAAVTAAHHGETLVLRWRGGAEGSVRITGRAVNLETLADQGAALVLHYRVTQAPEGPVSIGVGCTDIKCQAPRPSARVVTTALQASARGRPAVLSIPLSCFRATGVRLDAVEVPLSIQTAAPLQLEISEARITPGEPSATCPPLR